MSRFRRRQFLIAAAVFFAAPSASIAQQQGKVWRIGVLYVSAASLAPWYEEFTKAMSGLGYIEGQNVHYERRYADNKYEVLPDLAAELVRLKVDLIVASPTPAIRAAQRATKTIPIVMATGVDPVGTGLVASLAHPGGNITGMSNLGVDFTPKILEFLIAAIPGLSRVAVLANPAAPATDSMVKGLRTAARASNITLLIVEAIRPDDVARELPRVKRKRAQAIVVTPDTFLVSQRRQIAETAAKLRLPVSGYSETAEAGGLISYGPSIDEPYRRAATYVDKILRGAKPADLPVEQVTQLKLVLNMKTAKALGITFPPSILVRADRVIE